MTDTQLTRLVQTQARRGEAGRHFRFQGNTQRRARPRNTPVVGIGDLRLDAKTPGPGMGGAGHEMQLAREFPTIQQPDGYALAFGELTGLLLRNPTADPKAPGLNQLRNGIARPQLVADLGLVTVDATGERRRRRHILQGNPGPGQGGLRRRLVRRASQVLGL